ncbi:MAG TPA: SpvB/TcaC N-terminal domain-containing protein, partial [Nitrospiria bacterium]|nr:SpvB/TcaC N-terminal domain-containing protein [Nitrospiria bacterium]
MQTELFTGALTESIPIDVPAGRHGIQPALTLNYRSDRGNGWTGAGWELSAGSIERKSRTGVNYNADDYILHLAGATLDLVNTNQTDGSGNPLYAPFSIDTGYRIQQLKDSSGNPYWQVTDPKGIRYLFGETSASRQDNPGNFSQIFQWFLDQVIDPQGNYLTVSYSKDQGQVYLDEIDYTGCCYPSPPTFSTT